MSGIGPERFSLLAQGQLSDYVTAIASSPEGRWCGLASAMGEVVRLDVTSQQLDCLQAATGKAIGCLAISADGQMVAAGDQSGQVQCWRWSLSPDPIAQLTYPPVWIDRMAWHPTEPWLAIGVGRSAVIWDSQTQTEVARLDFQTSSVLGLAWQPQGDYLALTGYQGTKIWHAHHWDERPILWETLSTGVALAWSPDGRYLAIGHLDNTLTVYEWGQDYPWLMRGFVGKVRQIVWRHSVNALASPLVAMCSGSAIILWEKAPDPAIGWTSQLLQGHDEVVRALAFQPDGSGLASAGADGRIGIWQGDTLQQSLDGVLQGFSSLAWVGDRLVAGGCGGEWLVWGMG